MTKHNKKLTLSSQLRERPDAIENREGALAFEPELRDKFLNLVSTCVLMQPQFYRTGTERMNEIVAITEQLAKTDPEFLVKALTYIRQELNIRNLPIELLARASIIDGCKKFVREYADLVLHRADSIVEFAAFVQTNFNRKFNKTQRTILKNRALRLDEYEVTKYFSNEKGRIFKLRDILRLCHPKVVSLPDWKRELIKFTLGRPERQQAVDDPNLLEFECTLNPGKRFVDERYDSSLTRDGEKIRGKFNLDAYTYDISKLPKVAMQLEFNQLAEYTERAREIVKKISIPWNKVLSQFGTSPDKKKLLWTDLAPTIPMTALLMNLRNLLVNRVDPDLFTKKFCDEQVIKNSRLLPYQFYRANVAITNPSYTRQDGKDLNNAAPGDVGQVVDALNTALELSLWNAPKFDGDTVIIVDTSGSMWSNNLGGNSWLYDTYQSRKVQIESFISCAEVASLLSAMLLKLSDERGKSFTLSMASNVKPIILSRHDSVLTTTQRILNVNQGGATNGHLIPPYLNKVLSEKSVNRVIIVTDMQMWDSNGFGRDFCSGWTQFSRQHPETFLYFLNVNGYGDAQVPSDFPKAITVHGWSDSIFKFIPEFEQGRGGQVEYIKTITPEKYRRK